MYFKQFPIVGYTFGNDLPAVAFQDLTAYVDVVDRLKDNLAFYEFYHILEGDRPDQVSQKLYGSPNFYYLFFLMNNNIRERGWPLTLNQVNTKVKKDFPNTTITTQTTLIDRMKPTHTVLGALSGATGKIVHRNLDLGQLVIEGTHVFNAGEVVSSPESPGQTITITGSTAQSDSIAYFRNASGKRDDIATPGGTANAAGVTLAPVTYAEDYREQNDILRKIKVPRAEIVSEIDSKFIEELNVQ